MYGDTWDIVRGDLGQHLREDTGCDENYDVAGNDAYDDNDRWEDEVDHDEDHNDDEMVALLPSLMKIDVPEIDIKCQEFFCASCGATCIRLWQNGFYIPKGKTGRVFITYYKFPALLCTFF